LHEFEDLLAEAGFTDILVTADYKSNCTPGHGDGIRTFHATPSHAR
jgi:hypothetical protein